MRILLTGHTGFKGSWLTLLLKTLGHEVHGISLNPLKNGIFELASVGGICSTDRRIDIRTKEELRQEFKRIQPEVVFHLAAQALVLSSYEDVSNTYTTNVSGTLNVLDCATSSSELKAIIVVTTDKVYESAGGGAHAESDPLGGSDPYSSSKAIADLLTQSWSKHNPGHSISIARSGNVIGGGDVSPNRLLPDIFKSIRENEATLLRHPNSIRPWQHVLDCLNGYVALMNSTLKGSSGVFNFGPVSTEKFSVKDVAILTLNKFGRDSWVFEESRGGDESDFLALDSTKARLLLGWENRWDIQKSIEVTASWEKAAMNNMNMRDFSVMQIEEFLNFQVNR